MVKATLQGKNEPVTELHKQDVPIPPALIVNGDYSNKVIN